MLYYESGEALEQVAQRSYGCPLLWQCLVYLVGYNELQDAVQFSFQDRQPRQWAFKFGDFMSLHEL